MSRAIFWFRRDLRTADHEGLLAACTDHDAVLAVFVGDPTLLAIAGPARRRYLADALTDLDTQLDGRLHLAVGSPAEVLPWLVNAHGIDAVYVTNDVTPRARATEAAVEAALAPFGVELRRVGHPTLVAPGTVRSNAGTPLKVFTPFAKRLAEVPVAPPLPRAEGPWIAVPSTADVADLLAVEAARPFPVNLVEAPAPTALPRGGTAAALERLERFATRVEDYADRRNSPAHDATSRLSADLHFGVLHPRTVWSTVAGPTPGREAFTRQLLWREFYAEVLFQNPTSTSADLNPNGVAVDAGPVAEQRFVAWALGRTGYPLVDAGMRQLLVEGWMHNRVRMLVASFLIKDLHLDWRWGASWFLHRLVDGDVANNAHGWQWTAGVGTDASPYYRIFNPTLQAEKFDPTGAYVHAYLPELLGVPAPRCLQPGGGVEGGLFSNGYFEPMVDHLAARDEALRRLDVAKKVQERS